MWFILHTNAKNIRKNEILSLTCIHGVKDPCVRPTNLSPSLPQHALFSLVPLFLSSLVQDCKALSSNPWQPLGAESCCALELRWGLTGLSYPAAVQEVAELGFALIWDLSFLPWGLKSLRRPRSLSFLFAMPVFGTRFLFVCHIYWWTY